MSTASIALGETVESPEFATRRVSVREVGPNDFTNRRILTIPQNFNPIMEYDDSRD